MITVVIVGLAIFALGIVCGIASRLTAASRRGGQRRVKNAPPLRVYSRVPGPPPRDAR